MILFALLYFLKRRAVRGRKKREPGECTGPLYYICMFLSITDPSMARTCCHHFVTPLRTSPYHPILV